MAPIKAGVLTVGVMALPKSSKIKSGRAWSVLLLLSGCLTSIACGGGNASAPPPSPSVISVTILPTQLTLPVGQTFQFKAAVNGTSDTAIIWQVNGKVGGDPVNGTISTSGLYTAPTAVPPSSNVVTVAALSHANPGRSATAQVDLTNPPIPAAFWGMHINKLSSYPLAIPYGQFRGWDGADAQWPGIEGCEATSGDPGDPCFNWTNLDSELADLHQAAINDILYTLSRTPQWASINSNDPSCDYYPLGASFHGACYPPSDLNADGSGPNLIWKEWVQAVATRVNDPAYLKTHAHIKYWEIWNEFSRSATLENSTGSLSWQGTYNQLVRLAEDARCVITGKGVLHNVPSTGQVTTCSANAIDAHALIVAPSHGVTDIGLDAIGNFLYCNHNPLGPCTVADAGAQAVDIINPHLYAVSVTPEYVVTQSLPSLRRVLQSAELQKPMWNGEGSWGRVPGVDNLWQSDSYARAGFIPRFFALYWSVGLIGNYWYSYDTNSGKLFDRSTNQLVTPEATAWTLTYNWLANAVPTLNPFCQANGTIYYCDFGRAGGYVARLVWDSQYGQNCLQMGNPVICGSTSYGVPAQFNKDWIDLAGTVHAVSSSVTIGANPILLEGQN